MEPEKSRESLLAEAAKPVLERIRLDSERIGEPIRAIVTYIHDHLFDEELSVATALKGADVHSNTAKMRFRSLLRVPIGTYIQLSRLEIVVRLFAQEPRLKLHEVSEWVGYRREHTFKIAFRRCFGSSPGRLRDDLSAGAVSLTGLVQRLWQRYSTEPAKPGAAPLAEDSVSSAQVPDPSDEGEPLQEMIFEDVFWPAILDADEVERRQLALGGFRFQTDALFRGLLRYSREGCRHDRKLGVKMAERALDALWALRGRLPPAKYAGDEVEALANLGNARRLAADDDGADREFARAELILGVHPIPDRVQGLFYFYQGHLRTFQRRFPEAEELLSKSVEIRQRLGETEGMLRTLVALGECLELQGDLDEALHKYIHANNLLTGAGFGDAYLILVTHQHLANVLGLKRHFEQAHEHLEISREFAETIGSREIQSRLSWLEGLLKHGEGDFEVAEAKLLEALHIAIELEETINASLLHLDLGALLLEQGRSREAQAFMVSALPTLKAARLDREAVAALDLLDRALKEENSILERVSGLRDALRARFRPPG